MAIKILSRDDESLKNGSYYRVRTYAKQSPVVAVYVLGDFQGFRQAVPSGLREYSVADAKRFLKH